MCHSEESAAADDEESFFFFGLSHRGILRPPGRLLKNSLRVSFRGVRHQSGGRRGICCFPSMVRKADPSRSLPRPLPGFGMTAFRIFQQPPRRTQNDKRGEVFPHSEIGEEPCLAHLIGTIRKRSASSFRKNIPIPTR